LLTYGCINDPLIGPIEFGIEDLQVVAIVEDMSGVDFGRLMSMFWTCPTEKLGDFKKMDRGQFGAAVREILPSTVDSERLVKGSILV